MLPNTFDVIIIGGGAAGFFTAINCAEKKAELKIAILERGKEVLTKVKISGGGRCNVTNATFEPNELVKFYPRGEKELRSAFHRFHCGDTMQWFQKQGVALKTEEDGRVFPVSNSSQTIIDCFQRLTKKHHIQVYTTQSVQALSVENNLWKITTQSQIYFASNVVFATGSNPKMWQLISQLGHTIVPPVPSLFTFNINNEKFTQLMGISAFTSLKIKGSKLNSSGNVLITHWGLSGPAVLKLSAFGARELFEKEYKFTLQINWANVALDEIITQLKIIKTEHTKKAVISKSFFGLSSRLWHYLVEVSGINEQQKWADISNKNLQHLAQLLYNSEFEVNGKSTFKEEFVTAGGIALKEIDFKTMQSKLHPNLYFAGEVLNIDAITGGFNFQNAWTGGFIVAESISKNS